MTAADFEHPVDASEEARALGEASRTELLTLECRLRLIQHASKQDREAAIDPLGLWIEAFWAGVKAQKNQRSKEKLLALLAAAKTDLETVTEGFGR